MRKIAILMIFLLLAVCAGRFSSALAAPPAQGGGPNVEPQSGVAQEETPSPTDSPPAEEVTITGIEPKRVSQISGGSVSIYGTGFYPGIAVRLVGHGLLDSVVLSSSAIKAVVPPGASGGSHDLILILADSSTVYVKNAVRITEPEPTPTVTPFASNALVFGRPQVLIQSVEITPDIIRPGAPFTVTLSLTNRGDWTAANIRVGLNAQSIVVPREGSSLRVVDFLAQDQEAQLVLSLALNKSAPAGFQNLPINLDYSDTIGRAFTSPQDIGLNVDTTSVEQPLVLLRSYQTEPAALSPGDSFLLKIAIENVGKSSAEQILVTLGGESGPGLQPFAILDSGNVTFIPALDAGAVYELEQRFVVDGSAESGVYNLPVNLSYNASDQTPLSASQNLNLLVSRRPQFKVGYYEPVGEGEIDQALELPIELVNIGRSAINVSTMEITGPDLEITEGSSFIGSLDGGTAGSFDAVVIPKASGVREVTVIVNYLDDFNQPQTFEQILTINVAEPYPEPEAVGETETPEEETGFLDRVVQFLRGLFGIGN
jgi:hypothetical protein